MLSKNEENLKKKILAETNKKNIIKIYKKEDITMNILNDKEVREHLAKYITIKEPEDAGHIYIRRVATENYIKNIDKIIKKSSI